MLHIYFLKITKKTKLTKVNTQVWFDSKVKYKLKDDRAN